MVAERCVVEVAARLYVLGDGVGYWTESVLNLAGGG